MSVVTFGELLKLAGERLAAAETGLGETASDLLSQDLHRMVSTLAGLSADALARRGASPAYPRGGLLAWESAASQAHQELRAAASYLPARTGPERSGPFAEVAATLAAARDLLATHHEFLDSGELAARSPWADAIASTSVTRALIAEVARWSALLTPWVRWLAVNAPVRGRDDPAGLAAACRCLWLAGAAAGQAQVVGRTGDDDASLLYGIPAATPPSRVPPDGTEQVAGLCAGITATAERLRLAAFTAPDYAAWSPSATARAWQQAATSAGIISDLAGPVLRTLAQIPDGGTAGELRAAARSLSVARDSWCELAAAWAGITTETSLVATRANTETSDLVLRIGRLALDNPQWTPARVHRDSPLRAPSALVGDRASVAEVTSAVHQAADALAVMAAANLTGVTAAAAADRFHVPTRTLTDRHDIPRAFAPAPPRRLAELQDSYREAVAAARTAARELAGLAIQLDGPSKVLALARNATARPHTSTATNAAQLAAMDTVRDELKPGPPLRKPRPRPADPPVGRRQPSPPRR
jgi:hypothetical protein